MRNLLFITALLGLFSVWGRDDFMLTGECQQFRNGDVLERRKISYVEPGDSGENKFWDLSSIDDLREGIRAEIASANDTLFCIMQSGTMYKARKNGDTLLAIGYENRTTVFRDSIAAPFFTYPFGYRQKCGGQFRYSGRYALDRDMIAEGFVFAEADASGRMLLSNLDTLDNVLRVHFIEERKEMLLQSGELLSDSINDNRSVEIHENSYFWFAKGYRYPILESYITESVFRGKTIEKDVFSFYYPPERQLYLREDVENERIRTDVWLKCHNFCGQIIPEDGRGNQTRNEGTAPEFTFGNSKTAISISGTLSEPMEIEIILADMQGRVFSRIPRYKAPAGTYLKSIAYPPFPGEYLLSIFINGMRSYEKKINR